MERPATVALNFGWLADARTDIAFFFAPLIPAIALFCWASHIAIGSSVLLTVVLLQGLGVGPFHLGATYFHFLDKRITSVYAGSPWRACIVYGAMVIIAVFCIGGSVWFPTITATAFILWTVQHLVKQNTGILLLYHNWNSGEAIVDKDTEIGTQHAAAWFFSLIFVFRTVCIHHQLKGLLFFLCCVAGVQLFHSLIRYCAQLVARLNAGESLNVPMIGFWLLSVAFIAPLAFCGRNYNEGLLVPLVMHWFQYVGINLLLVRRKYSEQKASMTAVFFTIGVLCVVAVMGLEVLAESGLWPNKTLRALLQGAITAIAMIHYFQDALIWRFRNPVLRERMLAYIKKPAANTRANVQPLPASVR